MKVLWIDLQLMSCYDNYNYQNHPNNPKPPPSCGRFITLVVVLELQRAAVAVEL